ncbi:ABC transporter substrate-binding protein [Alphaproteobacteria bacterium]|nr:ABC transporter substrate-binding protein [Alphaproteobacteria bacterium]
MNFKLNFLNFAAKSRFLASIIVFSLFVPTSLWAADTIKLGLNFTNSGALKTQGEGTEVAVDIAVQEINASGGINGKKIELIKYETGSDPKQAVVGTRKLAEDDKVLAIIGPFSSGEAAAAFPVGERLGIVQVPNASSAPGLTKDKAYGFRLTEDEGKQFARLMQAMKRKNVPMAKASVVYASDNRITSVVGKFIMPGLLKKFGAEVSEPIGFTVASFDVAPQVTKVMEHNPDVVGVAGFGVHAAAFYKELKKRGFKGRIIGSQLFADPIALESLKGAEGTLFAAGYWRTQDSAATKFTNKFVAGTKKAGIARPFPHHVDAQAYDIVYLFKQVIEAAGVTGNPSKLKEERNKIRDQLSKTIFSGVTGSGTCFDANGDAELPGYIIEIKNGDWSKFDEFPADKCG